MGRYATHINILRLLDICTSNFNATSSESVTIHYSLPVTRDRTSLCSESARTIFTNKKGGVIKRRLFIYHISIIYNNILKSVVQSADSNSESQSQAAPLVHHHLSPRLDTDPQAQMLELRLPILAMHSPHSTRCKVTSIPTI